MKHFKKLSKCGGTGRRHHQATSHETSHHHRSRGPVTGSDRVLRSRRPCSTNQRLHGFLGRPHKRLFTPEIKRQLKQWLVRRRRYPYPTREEKRSLALDTGLDYSQVCNWFANWRRKLKNTEGSQIKDSPKEGAKVEGNGRASWGQRILRYNTIAARNAEKIPIDPEDGLPGDTDDEDDEDDLMETSSYDEDHREHEKEEEMSREGDQDQEITVGWNGTDPTFMDHCYSQVPPSEASQRQTIDRNGNYCTSAPTAISAVNADMHSKWLASVAQYRPGHQTFSRPRTNAGIFLSWASTPSSILRHNIASKRSLTHTNQSGSQVNEKDGQNSTVSCKDELDAAEALTNLSRSHN